MKSYLIIQGVEYQNNPVRVIERNDEDGKIPNGCQKRRYF